MYQLATEELVKKQITLEVKTEGSLAENYMAGPITTSPETVTIKGPKSVIGKIRQSYYEDPRHMQLCFYYPEDEYMAYLMTEPELMFVDAIDCQDLFTGENKREQIVIFEMG